MAELTKLPAALQERVAHSLAIIYQALDTYKCANLPACDVTTAGLLTLRRPGELSISYNGGKDSCVMVHLMYASRAALPNLVLACYEDA